MLIFYLSPSEAALVSGEVDYYEANNQILIDNMTNGFDIYPLHHTTPTRSYLVENKRKFIKAACFAEKGKVVVCGSDHGRAYIFSSSKSTDPQILQHGDCNQMVQTAAVRTQATEMSIYPHK